MDIPQNIAEAMLNFIDENPEFTHAAVRYDGLGGWDITYTKNKHRAEQATGGMDNTEVIEFVEE